MCGVSNYSVSVYSSPLQVPVLELEDGEGICVCLQMSEYHNEAIHVDGPVMTLTRTTTAQDTCLHH